MEDSHSHTYYGFESPFIKYFNRCKEIGMSKLDIQKNFKYLDKIYSDMVLDKLSVQSIYATNPSLDKLFNNWCSDENMN